MKVKLTIEEADHLQHLIEDENRWLLRRIRLTLNNKGLTEYRRDRVLTKLREDLKKGRSLQKKLLLKVNKAYK